jgi:hypothetical protein
MNVRTKILLLKEFTKKPQLSSLSFGEGWGEAKKPGAFATGLSP